MIFLLVAAAVVAGCASTVDPGEQGTGPYRWQQRELKGELAGPLLEVADAAERAFSDLRLIAVDRMVDGLKGTVTASTADGDRVRVRLKATGFETTRFSIKVGPFGDKAMSRQVARYIGRELAAGG